MGTFSRKEAIQFGWNIAKNNIWFFVKILLLYLLAFSILNLVTGAFKKNIILSILLTIVSIVVRTIISIGFTKISLNFCYRSQSSIKDLFSYYHFFFKYFFADIIRVFIIFIGLILFIIPGIIFAIRFRFIPYFIVDKNLGPIESLRKSWQITKGLTWYLFVFDFILVGIIVLGTLALLIGLFWALPTVMIANAFAYTKLLSRLESHQSENISLTTKSVSNQNN